MNKLKEAFAGTKREVEGFSTEKVAHLAVRWRKDIFNNRSFEDIVKGRASELQHFYGRFGLSEQAAIDVAAQEILGKMALTGEEQRARDLQADQILNDQTTLSFDPQITAEILTRTRGLDEGEEDPNAWVDSLAELNAVILGIPPVGMDEVREAQGHYAEACDWIEEARAWEGRGEDGSDFWERAEATFVDFFTQLEAVRMKYAPSSTGTDN